MSWNVKGVLFSDYVRIIRSRKDVDWKQHILPEDMTYLGERIDLQAWYPMAVFERIGNAIGREITHGNLSAVQMWGRLSVQRLSEAQPGLVVAGDPVETLMRFRVLRSTYFDFDALQIPTLTDGHAQISIRYYMGAEAEETASHQTLGFFEGLLEAAGAHDIQSRFIQCAWQNNPPTLLEIDWSMG